MAKFNKDLGVYVDNQGLITEKPRLARTIGEYAFGIGLGCFAGTVIGDSIAKNFYINNLEIPLDKDTPSEAKAVIYGSAIEGFIWNLRVYGALAGTALGAITTKLMRKYKTK
ncbi:MAG: hypothetical protein WC438_00670 [Candidatus Pacearchaeota archaeon]